MQEFEFVDATFVNHILVYDEMFFLFCLMFIQTNVMSDMIHQCVVVIFLFDNNLQCFLPAIVQFAL